MGEKLSPPGVLEVRNESLSITGRPFSKYLSNFPYKDSVAKLDSVIKIRIETVNKDNVNKVIDI